MESDKQHFRHILLFYYRKGKNAVQARKKLTDVYGEGVLTVRQCQRFAKFRSGNFDVKDAQRSGRPVEADKGISWCKPANNNTWDRIEVKFIKFNSLWPLERPGIILEARCMGSPCSHRGNLCRRIAVCDSLLKRHENDPFLKRIITGDEKWVVYNNVKRKRSWSKKDEPAQTIFKADKKRWCCLFGEILKESFFFSFYRITQRLIRKSTVISWTNWMMHFSRKGQN